MVFAGVEEATGFGSLPVLRLKTHLGRAAEFRGLGFGVWGSGFRVWG